MKSAIQLFLPVFLLPCALPTIVSAEPARSSPSEQWSLLEPQVLKAPVGVELGRNPLQPLSSGVAVRSFQGERAELAERLARYLKGRIKSVIRDGDRSQVFIGSRGYVHGQELSLAQEGARSVRSLKIVLKRIEAERLVFLVTYSESASVLPADVVVPLDPFCCAR